MARSVTLYDVDCTIERSQVDASVAGSIEAAGDKSVSVAWSRAKRVSRGDQLGLVIDLAFE